METELLISILVGILAIFFKDFFFSSKSDRKENTKAITTLTISLARLEIQVEELNKTYKQFYRLKNDVDELHDHIRDLDFKSKKSEFQ